MVSVVRTNATTSAIVNEIALEEKTLLNLPVIRDLQVTNIGDTAATISWLTDVPTDGAGPLRPDGDAGRHRPGRTGAGDRQPHPPGHAGGPGAADHLLLLCHSRLTALTTTAARYYQFTTGPTLSLPPSDLIYGQVFDPMTSRLAAGALVYGQLRDADAQDSPGAAAPLSALVEAGGYWSLRPGGARTTNQRSSVHLRPGDRPAGHSATDGTGCTANQIVNTATDPPAPSMILVCPTQVTHSLAAGWNLAGLTVQTDPPTAAEAALDDIVAQGGSAIEIERWWNGGWDAHVRDLPFNNFTLELGRGYFVRANAASTWTRSGTPPIAPLPVNSTPAGTWSLSRS